MKMSILYPSNGIALYMNMSFKGTDLEKKMDNMNRQPLLNISIVKMLKEG